MPDFSSLGGGGRLATEGEDTGNSRGTQVDSSTTANTKGSFTEIVASTPFDADGIVIFVGAANADSFLLDVAVGASASEQVVIPDIRSDLKGSVAAHFIAPISIAASSRISVRVADDVASARNYFMGIGLLPKSFFASEALGRATAYGVVTGDSGGTQIDPGANANTKGSYAQIVASTTNPMKMLCVSFATAAGNHNMTTYSGLVDIAVGAAASEQIIFDNIHTRCDSISDNLSPVFLGPIPVNIPSGTRVAVRAQSNITDATDRLFDVVIYGFD